MPSSGRRIPPLRIALQPSRILLAALCAAHLAAAAAVLVAKPGLAWSAPPLLALAISAVFSIRRHALLRGRRATVGLRLEREGELLLERADGTLLSARIEDSSYVSAHLIVLNAREPACWRRRNIVLLPDAMAAEAFRRLRMRLRWSRPANSREWAAAPPL